MTEDELNALVSKYVSDTSNRLRDESKLGVDGIVLEKKYVYCGKCGLATVGILNRCRCRRSFGLQEKVEKLGLYGCKRR
jgi:hypothetical protein